MLHMGQQTRYSTIHIHSNQPTAVSDNQKFYCIIKPKKRCNQQSTQSKLHLVQTALDGPYPRKPLLEHELHLHDGAVALVNTARLNKRNM